MSYDDSNIFARILRGEIPAKKVYEDDHVLAFEDISPKAPVHTLVIPKGPYKDLAALAAQGTDAELAALVRALAKVAEEKQTADSGYRVICNTGEDGGQEVDHVHFHVLGGKPVGRMISRAVMAEG
ncbi:histidine triad nucleotide-binding protein [Roseospirillum parvum]|uniref:Diadenosine tetraphosphate (Ap4A) hydrolase n=1 Tax=Roseospirillum parvum TaxID=83401 RepID=A0A1G8DR03_9PROT|nr:histidine triad nucleotide-binding protein [Roseospirillum parvum]SDH60107.1 Diadenosine tetraphosphate (Ap4A) hydrolase [Roseospirillum parvum]